MATWPIGDRLADRRIVAPSAERNKGPILDVLKRVLPMRAFVVEIGSGTGQHAIHFAKAMPMITWQPTDFDAEYRESVKQWTAVEKVDNILPPLALDVRQRPWPVAPADAVVSINMVHVAPWSATTALFEGAADIVRPGGIVFLYGPYTRGGVHTAPSNAQFDASLRAHDPKWGIRDVDDVTNVAERTGFERREIVQMPANNLSLIFDRRA